MTSWASKVHRGRRSRRGSPVWLCILAFRLFSQHIAQTQSFQENRLIIFQVLKPLVSLIGRFVACSARICVDTHTQTDKVTPRCACVPRVNYTIRMCQNKVSRQRQKQQHYTQDKHGTNCRYLDVDQSMPIFVWGHWTQDTQFGFLCSQMAIDLYIHLSSFFLDLLSLGGQRSYTTYYGEEDLWKGLARCSWLW